MENGSCRLQRILIHCVLEEVEETVAIRIGEIPGNGRITGIRTKLPLPPSFQITR